MMTASRFLSATLIYGLSNLSTPNVDLLWGVYQTATEGEHTVEELKKTIDELDLFVGDFDFFLGSKEELEAAYATAPVPQPAPAFGDVYDVVKTYVQPFIAYGSRLGLGLDLPDTGEHIPPRFAPVEYYKPTEVVRLLLPDAYQNIVICQQTAAAIHGYYYKEQSIQFYVPTDIEVIESSIIKPISLKEMDTADIVIVDDVAVTSAERTIVELIKHHSSVHVIYQIIGEYVKQHTNLRCLYDTASRFGVSGGLLDKLIPDVKRREEAMYSC